ncbi:MAG: hypothetical protein ACR2FO_05455 [Actinomycetota bacterium]
MGRKVLALTARIVAAGVALVSGGILIYAFGGGWLYAYGLVLPTPWNIWATALLAGGLIYGVIRILRFGFRRRTPKTTV